jgi:subtilisin family serine protease
MSDVRAIFTNFGTDIDITAPGDEVISTDVPEIDYQSRFHDDGSGTSFSSPYVAGVAALLKSIGYVDPAAIEAQLEATADAGVVYDTFRTAVVPEPLLDAEEAVLGTEEGDN